MTPAGWTVVAILALAVLIVIAWTLAVRSRRATRDEVEVWGQSAGQDPSPARSEPHRERQPGPDDEPHGRPSAPPDPTDGSGGPRVGP